METNNTLKKILCVGIASVMLTNAGWLTLTDDGDIRGRVIAVPLKSVEYVFQLDLNHPTRVVVIGAMLGSIALYLVAGVLVWEFVAKRLGFGESGPHE